MKIKGYLNTLIKWIKKNNIWILRISLGIIYIWFGILKLMQISPAEALVNDTIFFLPQPSFYYSLAVWEVVIGIFFLIPSLNKIAIVLFFLHIGGTFLPLLILPEQTFTNFPHGLTIEGQYIIKNFALIACVTSLISESFSTKEPK